MALSKTIQMAYGVTIPDAYHRVNKVSILNKTIAWVDVGIYVDPLGTSARTDRYQFDYNINGENPVKQAYAHLKTLPEFAGATDC